MILSLWVYRLKSYSLNHLSLLYKLWYLKEIWKKRWAKGHIKQWSQIAFSEDMFFSHGSLKQDGAGCGTSLPSWQKPWFKTWNDFEGGCISLSIVVLFFMFLCLLLLPLRRHKWISMETLFVVFAGRKKQLKAQNCSTEFDEIAPCSVYPSVFSNRNDRDVDVTDFYVIWLFRTDTVPHLHRVQPGKSRYVCERIQTYLLLDAIKTVLES